jgi:hypothetical protein
MNEGTRVVDGDENDPNDAVVVWRPDDMTTADWTYEAGGETYTTAESNPDYPDGEQLVVVVFERALEEAWPEWATADSNDLYEGVKERNLPLFGFPEERLEPIAPESPGEVDDSKD